MILKKGTLSVVYVETDKYKIQPMPLQCVPLPSVVKYKVVRGSGANKPAPMYFSTVISGTVEARQQRILVALIVSVF